MPDSTITASVTFADLINAYDAELADLKDGYEETVAYIEEEWGTDARDRPIPADAQDLDDADLQHLAAMRTLAQAYDESGKQIQQRNHALETLADACDGDTFEVRMLTGAELMDIEKTLKLKAQAEGVDREIVEHYRKALVVDAATVEAPEGVPTDDGDPQPSEAGNPLTLALYEAVETLNQAGAVDFRAPGFGDRDHSAAVASSGPRTPSNAASTPFDAADATPDGEPPESGGS